MNRRYYQAVTDIYKAAAGFTWDDSNLASLPKVETSMSNSTNEVVLPALLKINKLEIKDLAGLWSTLHYAPIDEFKRSFSSFSTSSGFPTHYTIVGNYIWLNCAPSSSSVTLSNGLRFWVDREVDIFTTADTTQEPGIAEPFHRLLSLGAAYDWLTIHDTPQKAQAILAQYEQLRKELREFYDDFNRDTRVSIKVDPTRRTANFE